MEEMTFHLAESPTEEELQFFDALRVFNESIVGDTRMKGLTLFARDGEGRIVGGVRGSTAWSWLHVWILVVGEGCRRQGLGTRLLAEAEAEAAQRGCIGVHLETTSFQALPFYRKQGYTVFGELENCPPGHTCYFLRKSLL